MNIEVTGNDEVLRGAGDAAKKRGEFIKRGGEWLGVWRRRWLPVDVENNYKSFMEFESDERIVK